MRFRLLRPLLTAAAVFAFAPFAAVRVAQAQIPTLPGGQRPTPDQAQELLRSRPDLVQQLQQRLRSSGLTPDQVRARLRAEGYPESLLDSYLGGGTGAGASGSAPSNETLLDAMEALGIADSTELDVLRQDAGLTRQERRAPVPTGARDFVTDTARSAAGALPDSSRYARDSARAVRDSGLAIFGLDLFRNTSSTLFDPTSPAPSTRAIGLAPATVWC